MVAGDFLVLNAKSKAYPIGTPLIDGVKNTADIVEAKRELRVMEEHFRNHRTDTACDMSG